MLLSNGRQGIIMSLSAREGQRVEVRRPQSRGLRSMVAGGLTGAINIMIVFPTGRLSVLLIGQPLINSDLLL